MEEVEKVNTEPETGSTKSHVPPDHWQRRMEAVMPWQEHLGIGSPPVSI